jgi:alpha-D-xyloside xylohydrolase
LPGMQTMQMPWWFSPEAQEHFRFLSWLHEDLMPYWISLSVQASTDGTPLCRPLVWDYQEDMNTWRIDDQFTVGKFLLVAPILNSEPDRDIYLPEGQWIDFWDEKIVLDGKQHFRWEKGKGESGLWKFPLYIKRGAILPLNIVNEVSGFGNRHSSGYVTVAIWPEETGTSEFVMESSGSPVEFSVASTDIDMLDIDISESTEDFLLRIHLPGRIPVSIIINGNEDIHHYPEANSFNSSSNNGWFSDVEPSLLWIRLSDNARESHLSIRFRNEAAK